MKSAVSSTCLGSVREANSYFHFDSLDSDTVLHTESTLDERRAKGQDPLSSYTSFPVASPQQVGNFSVYGETYLMDFGHY